MTSYSAIAVETIIAIVEAPAVVPIPRTRNPEHAVDRAHRSADAGADRAADRTGGPIAFIRALLRTAHDALGMPDMGHREQCERERRARQIELRGRAGRQRRRRDLRLVHLVLSIAVAGRECASGMGMCNADVTERLRAGRAIHKKLRNGQIAPPRRLSLRPPAR